jgi:hypothetical protein
MTHARSRAGSRLDRASAVCPTRTTSGGRLDDSAPSDSVLSGQADVLRHLSLAFWRSLCVRVLSSYPEIVNAPSPEAGIFAWAWHRAKEFRARFWVGAAAFSLIVALIASRLPLPPHPTSAQNLVASVSAIVGATIMTTAGSYVCALVAAPFQQRDVLRVQLSESRAAIAALESSPVPEAHAVKLRQIALRVRRSVSEDDRLDYGEDSKIWQRAFNEHFVCVREIEAAFASLEKRLHKECAEASIDAPPWVSDRALYWLNGAIRFRAKRRLLGAPYEFEWWIDSLRPGRPVSWFLMDADGYPYGQDILHDVEDADARKKVFEEFFKRAETWPESLNIQDKWKTEKNSLLQLLTAAGNTDPITTKCFLCQGLYSMEWHRLHGAS